MTTQLMDPKPLISGEEAARLRAHFYRDRTIENEAAKRHSEALRRQRDVTYRQRKRATERERERRANVKAMRDESIRSLMDEHDRLMESLAAEYFAAPKSQKKRIRTQTARRLVAGGHSQRFVGRLLFVSAPTIRRDLDPALEEANRVFMRKYKPSRREHYTQIQREYRRAA